MIKDDVRWKSLPPVDPEMLQLLEWSRLISEIVIEELLQCGVVTNDAVRQKLQER